MVLAADKGAIASFSPTGFGLAAGHDILAGGLYQAIFDEGFIQLGLSTNYAKYYLYANSTGYQDLIDTYMLFGDPATRLKTNPTAVTLASFTGKAQPDGVKLDWETANENWLVGFNLYRSDTADGPKQKLNNDLITAKKPGQNLGDTYSFIDPVSPGGKYFYWLELVQVGGSNTNEPIQVLMPYWINLPIVRK